MSTRTQERIKHLKKMKSSDSEDIPVSANTRRQRCFVKNKTLYSSSDYTPQKLVDVSKSSEIKSPKLLENPRKIIKAKRLLTNQSSQQENFTANTENVTIRSKRSRFQRQARVESINSSDDDLSTALKNNNKSVTNSVETRRKINKKISGEKINSTENNGKVKNDANEVVITALESPISPSTSSVDLEDEEASFEPFHFSASEENLLPSTSGLVVSALRRRTFELESSINDISLLKSVSEKDSLRMSSIHTSDDKSLPSSVDSFLDDNASHNRRTTQMSSPWISGATTSSDSVSPRVSTPITLNKNKSLLKNVLTKEIEKPSTGKKFGSNVKMPNFAAIHKKAFERMESLSEYKKRKEDRAKMLLSGKKPDKSYTKTPKNDTRKQLRFASDTVEREKSVGYIPLPNTPMPKRVKVDTPKTVNFDVNAEFIPLPENTPMVEIVKAGCSKSINFDKKSEHTPSLKNAQASSSKSIHFETKIPKFNFTNGKENPFVVRKFTPKRIEKVKVLKPKNNFEGKELDNFGNSGCNKLSFNVKHVLKKEEIKDALIRKSKIIKINVEERRQFIKGVRSNRRFELLMNMRKGK